MALSGGNVFAELMHTVRHASLGQITGPGFDEDGIVGAVEKATEVYLANKQGEERFLDTYRRIGMAPFKEALYG